jgi:hypothetical protein
MLFINDNLFVLLNTDQKVIMMADVLFELLNLYHSNHN